MTRPSPLLVFGSVLLCIAYLLPGHYLPWSSFQPQWVSALAMLLLAWGLVGMSGRPDRLDVPWLACLALFLAIVPWLQFAFGLIHFRSDALLSSLYLLALALCIVAGAAPDCSSRALVLRLVFGALLAASAISVALALVQWLQIGSHTLVADLPPGGRPFGNLAQPNHLATLLSLGVVALLYEFQERRLTSVTTSLLLVWIAFGLVMTQSRTGWVSMGLLALWCLWRGRHIPLRTPPSAVVLVGLLFLLAILLWPRINDLLLLSTTPLQDRLAPGTRWLHWSAIWQAIWMEPWWGYGWQQVSLAQQQTVLNHAPSMEMIQNSHNIGLDLLVWNGVPIGALAIAAGLLWFAGQVRRCADTYSFVLVAAVGILGIHAMLEYPLDHLYFLLPLGIFAGLLGKESTRFRLPSPVFGLTLGVMACLWFWIGAEYLKVEQANRDVRLLLAGYGLDKVPEVPPPDVSLLDGPREYHRFMITSATVGMSQEELDWMRRVVGRNPYPPAMMRLSLALGLNGLPEEAALTLRRICHMHPKERCSEAKEAWLSAQQQFSVLSSIPLP